MVPSKTQCFLILFHENVDFSWEVYHFFEPQTPQITLGTPWEPRLPRCLQMPPRRLPIWPPDASQIPPDGSRCLSDASRCLQMPPRCLEMPARCLPYAEQMPPDASQVIPDVSRCLPDAFQMAPRWLSDDSSSMVPPLMNPTWFLLHDFSFMIPPSPWFLFHVPPSPLGLRHGHRRGSRFEAIFRYFWGLEIRLQKVRPKVPKLCPKATQNREKVDQKSVLELVLKNILKHMNILALRTTEILFSHWRRYIFQGFQHLQKGCEIPSKLMLKWFHHRWKSYPEAFGRRTSKTYLKSVRLLPKK